MKKYGIFVLVALMAVGFSAFKSEPQTSRVPSTNYNYWYSTNGTHVGALLYNTMPVDEAFIKTTFNPCPDASAPPCVIGSDEELIESEPIPSGLPEDAQIRRP